MKNNILSIKFDLISSPIKYIQEKEEWVCGVIDSQLELGIPPKTHLLPRETVSLIQEALLHSSNRVVPQALVDFINLKTGETEKVIDYIRRYGVFEAIDITGRDAYPSELKRYRKEVLNDHLFPFATPLNRFWFVHREISELLPLAHAISNRDEYKVEIKVKSFWNAGSSSDNCKYDGDWLRIGQEILTRVINSGINSGPHDISLSIIQQDDKLAVPVLSTFCIRPALYLMLSNYITDGIQVSQCENKECKKLFFATRASKRFCSNKCQVGFNVRKSRQEKREKIRRIKSKQM